MSSRYQKAYEALEKAREEQKNNESKISDKYKDYAQAYAALRGETKSVSKLSPASTNTAKKEDIKDDITVQPVTQTSPQTTAADENISALQQAKQKLLEMQKKVQPVNASVAAGSVPTAKQQVNSFMNQVVSASDVRQAELASLREKRDALQREIDTNTGLLGGYKNGYSQKEIAEKEKEIAELDKQIIVKATEGKPILESLEDSMHYIQEKGKENFDKSLQDAEDAANAAARMLYQYGMSEYKAGMERINTGSTQTDALVEAQEAATDYLNEQIKRRQNYNKKSADENPKYEAARMNPIVKTAADTQGAISYMIPAMAAGALTGNYGNVFSSAVMGLQGYASGYEEAVTEMAGQEAGAAAFNEGYTPKTMDELSGEASNYGMLEALNSSFGEQLSGGVVGFGSGLVDKTVTRYAGNALKNLFSGKPLLKTVLKTASSSLGEGGEEVVQSLLSTAAQKYTYNPDAKVDVNSLAYEGLLGSLMGAVYNVAAVPGRYIAYKSDYTIVNEFSKAAANVSSAESAEQLNASMDTAIKMCDEGIEDLKQDKQTEETKENISRLEYIKDNVSAVKEELESHKAEIINHNSGMAEALRAIANGNPEEIVKNAAELVAQAEEWTEPGENPVNAAIDYVVEEIRNKDEEIQSAQTKEEKREAEIDRKVYEEVDKTLRVNREEIERILEQGRAYHADTDYTAVETDAENLDASENIPESNVVLEKDADEYSAKHQKVIEDYATSVDLVLEEFISESISGKNSQNDTYFLGKIKEDQAAVIKDITGIDATGWDVKIESRMVNHIWKRHGAKGQADNSMENTADLARMQYIIDNADSVEYGGTSEAYYEPNPNAAGKQRKATTVLYSKKVNGTYYVVEAVPDAKRKTAFIVSAYISKNKKEEFQPADNASEKSTPGATSDTTSGISVFGTSSYNPVSTADNTEVSPASTSVGNDVNTLSDAQTPTTISDRLDTSIAETNEKVNGEIESVVAKSTETSGGTVTEEAVDTEGSGEFYDETEDSPVNKALRTAETDVYAAGNELLEAYSGDVKAAVDALYAEGNRLAKDGSAEAKARLNTVEAVRDNILSSNEKRLEQHISELNKYLDYIGIKNVVVDRTLANTGARGAIDTKTGTLYLSPLLSVDDAVQFTSSHEFFHYARKYNPDILKKALDLKDILVDSGIYSAERFETDKYILGYADIISGMTTEEKADYVAEEIASDVFAEVLSQNTDLLDTLYGKDRNLWQRFIDLLRDIADGIKRWLTHAEDGAVPTNAQKRLGENVDKILEEAIKRYGNTTTDSDTQGEAKRNVSDKDVTNTETGEAVDVRYSREDEGSRWEESAQFNEELSAWDKGGRDGEDVLNIGMTGDVLQGLGALENEIYIRGDKITAIMEKHPEITMDEIRKIPQILNNPVLILKSSGKNTSRQNTRLVIFGSVKAKNGQPVLSVLDLRPVEDRLVIDDMQKVTSVYTKDTNPVDFIRRSDVLYAEKNISTRLLRTIGFQMPIELHDSGYVGSISYDDQNVKIEGKKFDEVFLENADADIRFSRTLTYDDSDFTYRKLISKPDMPVVELTAPASYGGNTRPPRDVVVKAAIDNAREKNHPRNNNFNTFVENADTGADILVSVDGVRHGLMRKYESNAVAAAHIGELLENAVLINRHNARDGNGEGGIYLSVGRNGDELYICRIITNDNNKLENVEVLYALNAKKESAAHDRQGSPEGLPVLLADSFDAPAVENHTEESGTPRNSRTGSTISIAELLEIVKDKFADVLPEDVLSVMGRDRAKSNVSDSVKYSREVFTAEEKAKMQRDEYKDFLKKQYRSSGIFGAAVAIKPTARRKVAADIASGLPGITVDRVDAAIKKVTDILERPKQKEETAADRDAEAWNAAAEEAGKIVADVTEKRRNPLYDQYKDLRSKLRTTAIKDTLDPAEFGGNEGKKAWKAESKGLIRITTAEDALPIDTFYGKLCELYPEFFDPSLKNPADMAKRISEVALELKNTASFATEKYNPLGEIAQEAQEEITNRIISGIHENMYMTMGAEAKMAKSILERAQKQYANINRAFNSSMVKLTKEIDRQNKQIDKMQQRLSMYDAGLNLEAENKRFYTMLKKLYRELTEPTRKKHIPDGLKKNVAEILAYFEGPEYDKNKIMDAGLLAKLQNQVQDNTLKVDEKSTVDDGFLKTMRNHLDMMVELNTMLDAKSSDPETPAEVTLRDKALYMKRAGEILQMVRAYIDKQNEVFFDGKNQDAEEFAKKLIDDLVSRKRYGQGEFSNTLGGEIAQSIRNFADGVGYESMNANLFFSLIGESGESLSKTMRKAQDMQAKREKKYTDMLRRVMGKKYSTFAASGYGGKRIDVNIDGQTIDVSKAQLMALYVSWKRPAAKRHLEAQGACFLTARGEERVSRTFVITQKIMDALEENLTVEDKLVATAIQNFLSDVCGEWGNDASMIMYGFMMFLDPHYFPIRVSETVKMKNAPVWGSDTGGISLEYAGFTKRVSPTSTSPIVIGDIFDIADNHVHQMAMYSTYAPVCNDLQRVLKRPDVREAIRKSMGDKGLKYIDNFLLRANRNKLEPRETAYTYSMFDTIGNMAKRAAVSWNLSTVVKQPLSIYRAMSEIEAKYILQAHTGYFHGTNGNSEYARAYRRMIENSGVAMVKELGFSDTGFGKSLRQQYDPGFTPMGGARTWMASSGFTRGILKAYDKFNEIGMMGAAKMDQGTFVKIWKACELKVADKYEHLSETEKTEKVTEMFDNIIGKTQVVDSVMDNPPFKESVKGSSFGAFMNEPVMNFANIVVSASQVKNADSKEKKKDARKKLGRVVGGIVVSSVILEPIISSIFSGLRDEEDDSDQAIEKFLKNFVGVDLTNTGDGTQFIDVASSQLVDGIMGVIPVLGQVYSLVTDALQGYSDSRLETEGLTKLVEQTGILLDPSNTTKTTWKKVSDWLSAVSTVFGIPYNRLAKDIGAACRVYFSATDNHLARWNFNKLFYNLDNRSARGGKYFFDIMAAAYRDGDMEAYAIMRKELAEISMKSSFGVSAETITEAIETRGGKIEVGSQMWYVDLQAAFCLDGFNKTMTVEKELTRVYESSKNSNVLPSVISMSFSRTETYSGEEEAKKAVRTIKQTIPGVEIMGEITDATAGKVKYTYKITDSSKMDEVAGEAGDYSYMVLTNMFASEAYKSLTDSQKQDAIGKAYDYARKRSRKNLYSEYDMNNKVFESLYSGKATPADAAKAIVREASQK